MLLMQKSISDISLSLVLLAARYRDLSENSATKEEKDQYHLLLEIITPIVKTLPSEMGITSISNGLQILGGYGFCSEYILQQYYRDIRIFPIYEGTTGIQSLDLLARKIPMADGAALKLLSNEISQTIEEASQYDALKSYGTKLGAQVMKIGSVLAHLSSFAKAGDFERSIADASIFMDYFSRIVGAWLSLELAVKSHQAMITDDKTFPEAMYEQKIHTMKYYFTYELPRCEGLLAILMNSEHITIPEKSTVLS
jgi:butyryl-CoA dehydrogenase